MPTIFLRSIIIIEFQSSYWGFLNAKSFISSLKRRVLRCCDITGRMLKAYPLPFNTRCASNCMSHKLPLFSIARVVRSFEIHYWLQILFMLPLYVWTFCMLRSKLTTKHLLYNMRVVARVRQNRVFN